MTDPIIRTATLDDGSVVFDEFIAKEATVHIEAMGNCWWWISVQLADGRRWHINVGAVNDRVKPFARCDEEPA